MSGEHERKDLAPRQDPSLPTRSDKIRLGPTQEIDLAGLSPEAQEALRVKQAEMMIARDDRREKLKEDLAVTATKMTQYGQSAADAAASNLAVTITNTNDDALGRTEIMIGNTETAKKGKLSGSKTGYGDDTARTWIILALIAGAVIVLVAMFGR